MPSTSPARIDDDLYASARLVGMVQSRSASQQVVHWARIGRELEASGSVSPKEIAEVLAGSRSYDALDAKGQALVRAEWSALMDERRGALDLAVSFRESGRTWVELDDDGNVVEGSPRKRGGGRRAKPAEGGPPTGTGGASSDVPKVARGRRAGATTSKRSPAGG